MTKNKQDFDASDSIEGIILQFYVALDKCFELAEGESLYIEKDGDVSTPDQQYEVKNFADQLTDSHVNFWKTLNNWSKTDFDPAKYKSLILLTTQDYGEKTQFKDWNILDVASRLAILNSIFSGAKKRYETAKAKAEERKVTKKPEALRYMEKILGENNKDRLDSMLSKIYIDDNSPPPEELYEKIKTRYFRGIPNDNKVKAINATLGLLISPEIVANEFEVQESTFTESFQAITSIYHSATIIFPKKHINLKLNEDEIQQHLEANFVEKIKDIEYDEVVNDAITDYVITSRTIAEELKGRIVGKEMYEAYESELMKQIGPRYKKASRSCTPETTIRLSKDHYDEVMGMASPNLASYNDTHITYKNGTLHSLADDKSKGLIWKLKSEDEQGSR
jgi:hypothetical protein